MTQGRQLKEKMLRIVRTAQFIKDKAYDPNEDSYLQMQSLVLQVRDASEFMESLRPQQEEDDSQQVFSLVTMNREEEQHAAL